ncbi:peptide chain release factor N(5)-glutamine methyltransferase [Helicobacter sp. 13S00477-4]|uniref:peptide chain release factor N(5)-glutamine methyltransferase n=1 Tax=Helicobacter sp. 13S00477-4 TaxID=1905759 RepID=UPI000BA70531|nr:peptide chain release factor N(5)-glutamine methyltransferase [Helicobacter sp. 13S00477-4]PAF51613.1 protein-(glutamine-N5) methyltransferase, release factor-specific [Helicobacter sp. 13S00477-4]
MNVFEAIDYSRRELSQNQFDANIRVGLEAELLLAFVLKQRREWLHTWWDNEIQESSFDELSDCIARRLMGEPLEYIIGKTSFYGEEFYVDKRVLIPRTETEILVEKVLSLITDKRIKYVGEIGIGSGVISIMLALLCPSILINATDISMQAIEVAKINISRFATHSNNLKKRIKLISTDLFEGVDEIPELLISNPPYIANNYPLSKNVLFEPSEALFGGICGDEVIKRVIDFAKSKRISFLACEIGYDQKKSLEAYLSKNTYEAFFYQDLNGLDRGFVAQFRN